VTAGKCSDPFQDAGIRSISFSHPPGPGSSADHEFATEPNSRIGLVGLSCCFSHGTLREAAEAAGHCDPRTPRIRMTRKVFRRGAAIIQAGSRVSSSFARASSGSYEGFAPFGSGSTRAASRPSGSAPAPAHPWDSPLPRAAPRPGAPHQ